MLKVSIIGPVLNEVQFIGYSIMSALPFVHEFVYAIDAKSSDGTRELLHYIKDKYAHEKLVIMEHPTFHPHHMGFYNGAYNRCIAEMSGDAAWFLHADMIVTKWPTDGVPEGATAWWTQITSYAGDLKTVITKGRCDRWKNIHVKKMGLHYFGSYGSQNEDFYHSEITGKSYRHFGADFSKYPYRIMNSGIKVNHYCESKDYRRRFEKMKLCLKTLYPQCNDARIEEMAVQHPRVTLESSSNQFGHFEFAQSQEAVPEVFSKYKDEFESFKTKEAAYHG